MSVQTMSCPPLTPYDLHYYPTTPHEGPSSRSDFASTSSTGATMVSGTSIALHSAPLYPSWRQVDRHQEPSSYLSHVGPTDSSHQDIQPIHTARPVPPPLLTGWPGAATEMPPNAPITVEYRNLATTSGLGLSMPGPSHVPASPALTLSPPSL